MPYQMIGEPARDAVVYHQPSVLGALGEKKTPACPPLKFICSPDCASPSSSCDKKKALCNRVLGAINLAKRAAALLETKAPSSAVVTVFQQVFGQPPSALWEVPGRPGRTMAAGALVAGRFRAVANELQTSNTIYRCVDTNRCQTMKSGGGCSNGAYVLDGLGNFQIVDPRVPGPDL